MSPLCLSQWVQLSSSIVRVCKAVRADPTALLVMRADPEPRYDRFDQVLAEVKRAGITRLGFAWNEAMAELSYYIGRSFRKRVPITDCQF